jgi:hypothetical protein
MATPNAAAAEPVLSAEEQSAQANADFSSQLHDELLAEQGEDEIVAAEKPKESSAIAPKKPSTIAADKQISADKVLDLLMSGDLKSLAKELGRDPKEFRAKNSQFVRLRQQTAQQKRNFAQERQQVEHEKQTLAAQRANLQQTQAAIFKAVKHIEDEDWIGFLETATGRSFDEIQKQLVQNSLDPSAKEVRRLRAEHERIERERAEQDQKRKQEHLTAQQQQARNQYKVQLKAELLEDPDFVDFGDHPNMPRFLDAVFTEQEKAFDGNQTISVSKAAQRAIKTLLNEANSWSAFVTKFSGAVDTAPKKGKTNEPSARAASAARTRSVAKGQGGAPPEVRKMSDQEINAHFGQQLRAELSGR